MVPVLCTGCYHYFDSSWRGVPEGLRPHRSADMIDPSAREALDDGLPEGCKQGFGGGRAILFRPFGLLEAEGLEKGEGTTTR